MGREWKILTALMVAELASVISLSSVMPGLARWLHEFGSAITVGWIMSAYLLVSSAAVALCGKLGDLYGRKPMLMGVMAAVAFGGMVSYLGNTASWIIAGRAIQGLSGCVLPLCYALAREHLPASRFSFAVGVIVAAASTGGALAFLLGGVLVDAYGPSSVFVAITVASLAGVGAVWIALPRSVEPRKTGRIDWIGGLLFAPGIAFLLIAISTMRKDGIAAPSVLAWLGAGLAVLLVWHFYERRQDDPMVDLRLLGGRDRGLANAVMILIAGGAFQLVEILALLIQQDPATGIGLGQSATTLGLLKAPTVVCGVLGSLWAGWIAVRRGPRFPLLAGAVLMFASMAALLAWHDVLAMMLGMMLLCNVGVTATYASVPMVVIEKTAAKDTGAATGLMVVVRAVAQGVGAQLIAVLLGSSTVVGRNGTHYPDVIGYERGLAYLVATAGLALVFAFLLHRAHAPGRRADEAVAEAEVASISS